MVSFEEEVRSSENGVAMTWAELNDFARALDQTIDCQIVATMLQNPVSRERVERRTFADMRWYSMDLIVLNGLFGLATRTYLIAS